MNLAYPSRSAMSESFNYSRVMVPEVVSASVRVVSQTILQLLTLSSAARYVLHHGSVLREEVNRVSIHLLQEQPDLSIKIKTNKSNTMNGPNTMKTYAVISIYLRDLQTLTRSIAHNGI